MSRRICKKCGKSEVSTRAGSLTSFFFQHNFCQCKAVQPSGNKQKDSASSVCKNCGKSRPENKRVGSFTAFLFQELRCSCPGAAGTSSSRSKNERHTPTATRVAQRRQFTNSHSNSPENGTSQTVFQPGELIGGFRIKNQIGLGGMGIVYLVDHAALNRQFALKVLAPDLVNEQNWLRFQGEAKTMASLNHRTFVKVYDLGIHAKKVPFYSMDYLNGHTLEAILVDDGPIKLDQALGIFIEVLDGLAYAHRNGIIHRDLKPANIMVCTADGAQQIKILDFGISKFVGSDASKIQSLTAAGDIYGSPFYMSPEQCNGQTVDARSDIYSIGCSLFEVLSGLVPYEGSNSFETVVMHQEHTPPSLSDMLPELKLSPSVDLVIAKCLAKDPDERYQSAKELSIDLIRLKEGKDLRAYNDSYKTATTTTSISNKLAIGAAAAAALLVAAAAVLMQTDLLSIKELSALKPTISHIEQLDSSRQLEELKQGEEKKRENNGKALTAFAQKTLGTTNGHTIANIELLDQKLTDQATRLPADTTLQIKEFLKTRTEPYSTVKTVDGQKVRVFDFSDKFSIGSIGYDSPRTGEWTKAIAQGTIAVAAGRPVHLNGEQELASFPELLKFFRPNELEWVKLNDCLVKPARYFPDLAKQTHLTGLELRATRLTDADLHWLEKFPRLTSLDVGDTNISFSGLAKCKILPNIKILHACKLKGATPLLKELVKRNTIVELDLNDIKLTAEDFDLLAQLTNLRVLSLKESAMEDADLEKLSTLPHLKTLYIDRSHKLTMAAVEILKKFKSLKELRPPDQIEDSFDEASLRQTFPGLRII